MLRGLWADLADLALPTECAGCRQRRPGLRHGVCPDCVTALQALRPGEVRPVPAPVGLPPCHALGSYGGPLRETLLAYKEHGRHGLARPLGALLAEVVADAVGSARPLVLVPVPDTPAAARARFGDHLGRLARHCARRLDAAGWPVRVDRPVRALPRPDSVTLDSAGRAATALAAFRVRPDAGPVPPGTTVVLLDDIVTTGSTLAAISQLLAVQGMSPSVAAVLAATEKRHQR
ncbi:ComF family protein [Micromonospora fiedleri]|uniref:ComF family protein n=1 Tax=Micromonospora fiedleri TaxID=1157498 RepID=A0ABS1UHA0_9ACTN|nr:MULTISPECIES: phosphoribosyltransferase family protein [Micromonospora]MBL6275244.1 ComF family protein [Micromonospora fiedleri]WSK44087.1 phosphoribosyltransferase family protein [Micromonospora maris]